MQTGYPKAKHCAAGAVFSLTFHHPGNQTLFGAVEVNNVLVELVQTGSPEAKNSEAKAVGNLTSNHSVNREVFIISDGNDFLPEPSIITPFDMIISYIVNLLLLDLICL